MCAAAPSMQRAASNGVALPLPSRRQVPSYLGSAAAPATPAAGPSAASTRAPSVSSLGPSRPAALSLPPAGGGGAGTAHRGIATGLTQQPWASSPAGLAAGRAASPSPLEDGLGGGGATVTFAPDQVRVGVEGGAVREWEDGRGAAEALAKAAA